MNPDSIENCPDPDLRFAGQALRRAAKRAPEIALQMGTKIVINEGGVIKEIDPDPSLFADVVEFKGMPSGEGF